MRFEHRIRPRNRHRQRLCVYPFRLRFSCLLAGDTRSFVARNLRLYFVCRSIKTGHTLLPRFGNRNGPIRATRLFSLGIGIVNQ